MSLAISFSAQLIGLQTEIVTVEVDISNGLHAFTVVGLGDRAVDEAKDRISAAIKNSGYVSPKQKNQKVVISLAPADMRKEGTTFDLTMAIAYLAASGDVSFEPEGTLFLGELSLDGDLRRVHGLLPILCQAKILGFKTAFIPSDNALEASLARGITIYAADSLEQVIRHISGEQTLKTVEPPSSQDHTDTKPVNGPVYLDMSDIRGNATAKRGLEIAAAGCHNIVMYGPPGTGKTMLAQAFPSILPPLSYDESVEVTGIHSAAKILHGGLIRSSPFRAPHHTASYFSIIGGGIFPKPGEVTLAHRGVLFMDEFPEFDRKVLEALRQPLEERTVTISRLRGIVTFPAQCVLIASMNPCPCGKERGKGCLCTPKMLENYRRRLSGPIMDRMDIWINVNKIDYAKLASVKRDSESSEAIRSRVRDARKRQSERYMRHNIDKRYNGEMDSRDLEKIVSMEEDARISLAVSAEKLGLSGRAFHRIIKVGRTIADLAGEDIVRKEHILEALQYRQRMME